MTGSFVKMPNLVKVHKFKNQLKIRFICLCSQWLCGKKKGERERKDKWAEKCWMKQLVGGKEIFKQLKTCATHVNVNLHSPRFWEDICMYVHHKITTRSILHYKTHMFLQQHQEIIPSYTMTLSSAMTLRDCGKLIQCFKEYVQHVVILFLFNEGQITMRYFSCNPKPWCQMCFFILL